MSALSTQFGGMAYSADQAVAAVSGIILGPIDVQNYSTLGFYLHNKLCVRKTLFNYTLKFKYFFAIVHNIFPMDCNKWNPQNYIKGIPLIQQKVYKLLAVYHF